MSNELTVYQEVHDFAKAMVASGYFTDVKQVSQAIVKIQAGRELGVQPFASMSGIHIIKGRPQLGANLIASLIKNDPRYDFRVKEISDTNCIISFYEGRKHLGDSAFSATDAKRAGTQNMGKFPRNMLYARAMSNGAKWFVPGVFGGSPVYVEGELDNNLDNNAVDSEPPNVDIVTGEIVETPAEFFDGIEAPQDARLPEPARENEADAPPKLYSEFLKWYADQSDYYTSNMHVGGAVKKLYPDANMGVNFGNYSVDEVIEKLSAYAAEQAAKAD